MIRIKARHETAKKSTTDSQSKIYIRFPPASENDVTNPVVPWEAIDYKTARVFAQGKNVSGDRWN